MSHERKESLSEELTVTDEATVSAQTQTSGHGSVHEAPTPPAASQPSSNGGLVSGDPPPARAGAPSSTHPPVVAAGAGQSVDAEPSPPHGRAEQEEPQSEGPAVTKEPEVVSGSPPPPGPTVLVKTGGLLDNATSQTGSGELGSGVQSHVEDQAVDAIKLSIKRVYPYVVAHCLMKSKHGTNEKSVRQLDKVLKKMDGIDAWAKEYDEQSRYKRMLERYKIKNVHCWGFIVIYLKETRYIVCSNEQFGKFGLKLYPDKSDKDSQKDMNALAKEIREWVLEQTKKIRSNGSSQTNARRRLLRRLLRAEAQFTEATPKTLHPKSEREPD